MINAMLKLSHKNLTVYKKSVELVTVVYTLTSNFPDFERFGLISQLRRCAVSVPSNIAEGASRKSLVERKRFYEISRSSLVEMDTQIEISINLGHLNHHDTAKINRLTNEVFAMLSSMI